MQSFHLSLLLVPLLSLAVLAAPAPVPNPIAAPEPDPTQFYYPSYLPLRKRTLVKRAQAATSGPLKDRCGPSNASKTCGPGNTGLCCGEDGLCGATVVSCGGGCQTQYGVCPAPNMQIQWDSQPGDVIWDPISSNTFDAEVGDGLLAFGKAPTGGWPA